MKKILIYTILLVLIFFFSTKTVDVIIDKETDEEQVTKNNQWFEIFVNDEMEISKQKTVTPKEPTTSENQWWRYPETIYTTKRSGNDLLVLVNKEYKLPSTYAPKDLVKASNSGIRRGESYYLRNILIPDLTNMVNDAKAQGIDLSIVSGYRSYQTQVDTYNRWLAKNDNNVEYVDTFSARPGHSQHQLGTVIDFSCSEIGDVLGDSFANTKASKWLTENAYKYGFVISFPKGYENVTGYKFESWHYRYIGVNNAEDMIGTGQILELYLRGYNP